ncbi:MAG: hypothetical protein ACYDIE_02410 [Candidatus Krumholzibacteriia bacterium]
MTHANRIRLSAAAACAALALAVAPAGRAGPASMAASPVVLTATEAQAVTGFETRLKEYMALHNKLQGTLKAVPKQATPEQMAQNRQALSALLVTARAGARQGDFFTPGMQSLVSRVLASAMAGPGGRSSKDSIMDDNTGLPDIHVNERYPDGVPLTTMPLLVLQTLPKLDDGLEYRFVGHRLILMDAHAGTILDFTGNVLP